MLKIDKNELRKLIMEDRKKDIESPKYEGIGEIISAVSIGVSLVLGDFSKVKFTNPVILQLILWAICIVICSYGVRLFIKSVLNSFSAEKLFDEICDIDSDVEHPFNLVLIKSDQKDGKYLLFKNQRWKCFHFPSYKVQSIPYNKDIEQSNITNMIVNDIGITISEILKIQYIGDIIDKKFSQGDKMFKRFHFYFYEVTTSHNFHKIHPFNTPSSFWFNGKKYKWYTLDQMYNDKNIIKTNKNVLDFVRNQCTIS